MAMSFNVRGVIEGFYGPFYTSEERNDLIRFLGRQGFNFYLYGPKNDRQHRMRWWEPYPDPVLRQFGETIQVAGDAGVTFCYAISFGVALSSIPVDRCEVVAAKLGSLFDLGCRSFAVFLDDLTDDHQAGDAEARARDAARIDGEWCNRLFDSLRALDPGCTLAVCPTQYHGRPPFGPYLPVLGKTLHPAVDVFYTGPEVCSPRISVEDVQAFAQAIGRRPLIWDNYPVNDVGMRFEMHMGPLRGRDPRLADVSPGFLSNLMIQAEASKLPLLTVAQYLEDPERYDPDAAWQRAFVSLVGEESAVPLRLLAETSLFSCLQDEEAPTMFTLCDMTVRSLEAGAEVLGNQWAETLTCYLDRLDEACYHLKYRMSNLPLRQNLLPWIGALEDRIWLGRFALAALEAAETGANRAGCEARLLEQMETVRRNPERIGGDGVPALAVYAEARVREAASRPASRLDGISPADLGLAESERRPCAG